MFVSGAVLVQPAYSIQEVLAVVRVAGYCISIPFANPVTSDTQYIDGPVGIRRLRPKGEGFAGFPLYFGPIESQGTKNLFARSSSVNRLLDVSKAHKSALLTKTRKRKSLKWPDWSAASCRLSVNPSIFRGSCDPSGNILLEEVLEHTQCNHGSCRGPPFPRKPGQPVYVFSTGLVYHATTGAKLGMPGM